MNRRRSWSNLPGPLGSLAITFGRHLNLYGFGERAPLGRGDHQVARLTSNVTLYDLTDRSNRIDDRRSGRVRHERCQRLQLAGAVRRRRQREHVGVLGFQSRDRSLQYLRQPLIEERHAGRTARLAWGGQRQMRGYARSTERRQIRRGTTLGYGIGHIDQGLR